MAKVLVPLADGFEELEAITVIDLLRRAGFEVITAGLNDQPVRASRLNVLIPDTSIDKVINDQFDLIFLPGGLPGQIIYATILRYSSSSSNSTRRIKI